MDDLFKGIEDFEWDRGNQDKSLNKHGVSTKEAESVFKDYNVILTDDIKHSKNEKRYQALGISEAKRNLNIVFTLRKHKIRIISARLMNRKEKIKYEDYK